MTNVYDPHASKSEKKKPGRAETPLQKRFSQLLGELVSGTSLSLAYATSSAVLSILADFVKLGQENLMAYRHLDIG